MQSKVLLSFEDAVKDVPDGASILVPGFGGLGTPHNLVRALYFQGAKDLTLISNSVGGIREGLISAGNLIDEGRVKKAILSFTTGTHPSRPSPVERMALSGELDAEVVPQGTLAERIRAGGAGIPAFYTPAGVGTILAEGREQRVFNGRTHLLEEAIFADYAFIRAWKADEFGNLVFRRAQRNFNPIMAMAARITIVEAEQLVKTGEIDPDEVHTSGLFVHRVVAITANDILDPPRQDAVATPATPHA